MNTKIILLSFLEPEILTNEAPLGDSLADILKTGCHWCYGKFFRGVQFLFSTLSFFEWICGRSEHYLFLISFALMKIRDRMVSETRTQTEHLNFLGNKQESNWLKILVRGDNLMRRVVQIIYHSFNLWCVTVEYEIWTSFINMCGAIQVKLVTDLWLE